MCGYNSTVTMTGDHQPVFLLRNFNKCGVTTLLYTNKITCNNNELSIIKYAANMALMALLKDKHSLSPYRQYVDLLRRAPWSSTSSRPKSCDVGGFEHLTPHPLFEPLRIRGRR